MPTTAITYPDSSAGIEVAYAVVSTRVNWADAWTEQPDLHCRRLTLATLETISTAEFYWRFGQYSKSGETGVKTASVAVINPRCYVMVEVFGTDGRDTYTWFGIWDTATKRDQSQTFTAVGIEALLDQPCVDMPWLLPDNATVAQAGAGLEFNASNYPNRSAAKHTVNGQSVYVFSANRANAEYWSTRDAVETLLAAAAVKDDAGSVLWNWQSILSDLPDWDNVYLPTHGRSWLSLLRSLITRYRLVGARFLCEDDIGPPAGSTITLEAFSFAQTAIDVLDVDGDTVGTIPANAETVTVNMAADASAGASLSTRASHVVDQVVVTGARRQIVFTISDTDATLDKRWIAAEETDYQDGRAGELNYPPADDLRGREEADRLYRERAQVRSVYSWFGLPVLWDQKVRNGIGDDPAEPIAVDDADPPNQVWVWPTLLEFEDRLPLLEGYDYTADKIETEEDLGHHAEAVTSGPWPPLPLLVFLRTYEGSGPTDPDDPDQYVLAHKLGRNASVEQLDDTVAQYASCDVTALKSEQFSQDPGLFELRVQGEQQHLLAKTQFAGRDDAIPGALDWSTMIATVSIQEQRRVEVRHPADDDVAPLGEQLVRLQIDMPNSRLIEVRPNTIVGLGTRNELQWSTTGGPIVDDRPDMRLVAQRAFAWHSVPRYTLQYSTGWVDGDLQVGMLMVSYTDAAGTWPVNSVITEITLEFPVASSDRAPVPKCSVVTAFAELDAGRIAGNK